MSERPYGQYLETLSTHEKPVSGFDTGFLCTETDTGKLFWNTGDSTTCVWTPMFPMLSSTGIVSRTNLKTPTTGFATTPPSFGSSNKITVNDDGFTRYRIVWGYFTLNSGALNNASAKIYVETAPGSDTYSDVDGTTILSSVLGNVQYAFFAVVPTGSSYYFDKGGLTGTTEAVTKYNFVDV